MLAADGRWPAVALAIAIVVGLCLWGLFRRGSMSDRARTDDGQSSAHSTGRSADGAPDGH